MKVFKKSKLVAVIATLLLMLVAVPVAFGGIQWSGFDPQVQINGTQYNVTVLAPDRAWCDVTGPIDVTFYVDAGSEYILDFESEGGSGGCLVVTETTFVEVPIVTTDGSVGLEVLVSSARKKAFPVVIETVASNASGETVTTCEGQTNSAIQCTVYQ